MAGRGERRAGRVEVWAARAWNVFNEGRPFSLVYPVLCLLAAAPLGLGPDGPLGLALLGALAVAAVASRLPFALRGRVALWVILAVAVPVLELGRAPGLLAGALAGYAVFTVLVWGTVYYRLRTGAPWSNGLRFWRLVLTNSDPTSGNALEQVPKMLMGLGAGTLLAEAPGVGSVARVAAIAALVAALGLIVGRRFRRGLPAPPPPAPAPAVSCAEPRTALARRVYVLVVDGANRDRLRQARTPTLDRLAREGTEYLGVDTVHPARTVTCFASMLTGATPAEHGMRSNFVARTGARRPSAFSALEAAGRSGRLVGIAHLLDAFPERHVRSVTSVQPTERLDRSLAAVARDVVEREDPDLLVLQLLAVDQIGHVRGTRNHDYLEQLEQSDRRVGDLLAWLAERGRLEDATVIVMADHGQGRGIGGHGHLDWGESPVPFLVWGRGAVPGGVSDERRSVMELTVTVCRLLGVAPPAGARGRPMVPAEDAAVRRPAAGGSCLVVLWAPDADARVLAVARAALPAEAAGMKLEPVVGLRPGDAPAPAAQGSATQPDLGNARLVADQDPAAQPDRLGNARLVADDGSAEQPDRLGSGHPGGGPSSAAAIRARDADAALRAAAALARERGHRAVALVEVGRTDPVRLAPLLEPVAAGRAGHVLGSRGICGPSRPWPARARDRLGAAWLGTRARTVLWDPRPPARVLGPGALELLADDPSSAPVTRALAHAGVPALELPLEATPAPPVVPPTPVRGSRAPAPEPIGGP